VDFAEYPRSFWPRRNSKNEYQRKDEDAHPCLNFCLPYRCGTIGFSRPLGQDYQRVRANQVTLNFSYRRMAVGNGQAQDCAESAT
jgi:hypothetical protein